MTPDMLDHLHHSSTEAVPKRPAQQTSRGRFQFKPPRQKVMFTGLDIGTTKICAIIGEIDPAGMVTILGVASKPSQGLRRGVVVNLEETVDSIRLAIRKAEDIARVNVRDVFVGIAGGHIECHQLSASVDVGNPERGVSRADVRRVIDKAIESQSPVEREILHLIPQRFVIDDGEVIDPLGFSSRKLEARVLLVTAAVTSAQNIIRAVSQAGFRVSGIYLEPLASSLAVLTPEEKDVGVMLIDIGGGTSDVAIWTGGAVRYTGVVPFGGDAITEDISKVLKINCFDAENLKRNEGHCLPELIDPTHQIEVPSALLDHRVREPKRYLAEIVQCRVEEMLRMVKAKVENVPAYKQVYGGIVLTGGTSLQAGIATLAEKVFDKPCTVGVPEGMAGLSSVIASPIYSTGAGLVLYGLEHEHERERAFLDGNAFTKIVKKLKSFIDWYG